jgi:hypothetical protein
MARRARTSRRGGIKWAQVVFWILGVMVVLSMIMALLPIGQ